MQEGEDPKPSRPTFDEIRCELVDCVTLIENGFPVQAAARLTKLAWRLEGSIEGVEEGGKPPKKSALSVFPWENDRAFTGT
jgi:hypothetical protein